MKRLFFAFVFLALAAQFACAVSSSEAEEKASPYTAGEAVTALPQPLEVGADSYWIYYTQIYPPVSKKLVVAVSEYLGDVVSDEVKLSAVAASAYDYGAVHDFIEPKGYSFSSLAPAFSSSLIALQQSQANLNDLAQVVQSKYAYLDFSQVEANLTLLVQAADDTNAMFQEGQSQQQVFNDAYSASELSTLVYYYNTSFSRLSAFFTVYQDYLNAIASAQSAVFKSPITAPDNENIYNSLENLKDIGLSSLYSKFASSNPSVTLNSLYSYKRAWVNDSVSSFSFAYSKGRALEAYDAAYLRYQFVTQAKTVLQSCGIVTADVTRDWQEVEYYREKASAIGYAKMLELLPPVTAKIDSVYSRYQACISKPTASATPTQEADYSWLLYALVILLVAVYGYNWWKKKREEAAA